MNHSHISRHMRNLLMIFLCVLLTIPVWSVSAFAQESDQISEPAAVRPSVQGQLKVQGTALADENGSPVVLRGVSTHGIYWYPEYINADLFHQLAEEWNCSLIRLAMYTTEYLKKPEENLNLMQAGIDAAIQEDLYVMVDWHILEDSNPMDHVEEAREFFSLISEQYAGVPNLLYEICNEPNGDTTWEDICEYAGIIIPLIRQNSPDAVILVGTPDFDRDLSGPLLKRIDDPNVMYSFHFYSGSHHDELMSVLDQALQQGLAVYITECGISEESGDGELDYEYAEKWFSYLKTRGLSFNVWNLSNKYESSSFIKATSFDYKHLSEEDLTDTGKWVRELIRGTDPAVIPRGKTNPSYTFWEFFLIQTAALGKEGLKAVRVWSWIALGVLVLLAAWLLFRKKYMEKLHREYSTYDDLVRAYEKQDTALPKGLWKQILIWLMLFLSIIYLVWRLAFSINTLAGWLPIVCNLLLLAVELVGFMESCIHYSNMMSQKDRPLPQIEEEEYPEVDIFIATYNEPEDLLRKTINGCKHLKYPDSSKVHIWVCDDNRRPGMRKLAEQMGVGYFDRPDNQGAKAGNLNHAMSLTSAPYIVTLDADMIVRSEFLLKTIPYFVYAEKCAAALPEEKRRHLGLLQTPQSFYDPDVFQYALYSEKNVPNEQDFFYRSIEVGKTSTNSVIYGGSNTILSRSALEAIGGFYTGSITEDFATGLLLESAGYLSLAIPEPLASGRTPNTFREHIQQRTRWGRGVINTAKKTGILRRKGLNLLQKLSYFSSVVYWYSPIKNLIYLLAPLMYAVFLIPVFRCTWLELLIFWIPMFVFQEICLRVVGGNKISQKWSSIYETSVMPFLLIPVMKESLGISMSTFLVTDKSGKKTPGQKGTLRYMLPFLILTAASVAGIVRILAITRTENLFGMLIILFWVIRNLYSIVMVLFLINGRDGDEDTDHVRVKDAAMVTLTSPAYDRPCEGTTTELTEHSLRVFLDESGICHTGDLLEAVIETAGYQVKVRGVVTRIRKLRLSEHCIARIEILDFGSDQDEYLQILYDRIPSMPQSLTRDFGVFNLLWRNIVYRMMRTIS